jgi:hypothetical protein
VNKKELAEADIRTKFITPAIVGEGRTLAQVDQLMDLGWTSWKRNSPNLVPSLRTSREPWLADQ